jgi:hypothetical protein
MTGYTVHTGASKKFVAGWDRIFKGQKSAGKSKPPSTAQAAKSKVRRKK